MIPQNQAWLEVCVTPESNFFFFLFYFFIYLFLYLFIWKRFLCSSGLLIFKLLLYTVYTRKIFGKEALFFSAIVTWKKEELLFPKKSRIKSIMFCLSPSTLIINVSSFLIKIAQFYWPFIYIRFPLNIFYNYNRIR